MSRAAAVDANLALLAVAAAIGAGALAYGGLYVLARPAGLDRRMAEITRQADDAGRLRAQFKGPSPYRTDAICTGGADAAIVGLKQTVASAAAPTGVLVGAVTASQQAPDEANRGLQPITVSIDADGSYAGVVGLLQTLSRSTPSVFVDTLDLNSKAGVVALKLRGRVFCLPASL